MKLLISIALTVCVIEVALGASGLDLSGMSLGGPARLSSVPSGQPIKKRQTKKDRKHVSTTTAYDLDEEEDDQRQASLAKERKKSHKTTTSSTGSGSLNLSDPRFNPPTVQQVQPLVPYYLSTSPSVGYDGKQTSVLYRKDSLQSGHNYPSGSSALDLARQTTARPLAPVIPLLPVQPQVLTTTIPSNPVTTFSRYRNVIQLFTYDQKWTELTYDNRAGLLDTFLFFDLLGGSGLLRLADWSLSGRSFSVIDVDRGNAVVAGGLKASGQPSSYSPVEPYLAVEIRLQPGRYTLGIQVEQRGLVGGRLGIHVSPISTTLPASTRVTYPGIVPVYAAPINLLQPIPQRVYRQQSSVVVDQPAPVVFEVSGPRKGSQADLSSRHFD